MTRTTLIALLLAVVWVVPASAWDWEWGVTVDNTTQGAFSEWYEEPRLTQRLKTGIWSSGLSQLDSGGSLSFAASAGYTVTDDRAYLFDVDLLRITGRFPQAVGPRSFLQATAGRTRFADPTGLVINHVADGGSRPPCLPVGPVPACRGLLGAAAQSIVVNPHLSDRLSRAVCRQ